jgi:hypothetical protein
VPGGSHNLQPINHKRRTNQKIQKMSREREIIKQNTEKHHKALVLKVNRRLAIASKVHGIPLHKVRTRREFYGMGRNPVYLRNEETGEEVIQPPLSEMQLIAFDDGTRCMIRRNLKATRNCHAIELLLDIYKPGQEVR